MVQSLKSVTLALTVLAAGLFTTLNAQVLKTTDVSPDAPFGTPLNQQGSAPTGRVIGIVVDPTNESTLYAASEWAGVWKSVDKAHTWFQASNGLRSGITQEQTQNGGIYGPVLAIDAFHSSRLLYATQDVDGRPQPFGGVWVSTDGAASWQHVRLCPTSQTATSVVFAGETPYVSTSCGIFTSSDPDLSHQPSWQKLVGVPADLTFPILAALPTVNDTLFACQGTNIYRKQRPTEATPDWERLQNFFGTCRGLAGVPNPIELVPSTVAEVSEALAREVSLLDFDTPSVTHLGFRAVAQADGSGIPGVFIAPRANSSPLGGVGSGRAFDLYAADGCNFFAYEPAGVPGTGSTVPTWLKLEDRGDQRCLSDTSGLHADTWAMAFPPSYDPASGVCTAYATTDGGVFAYSPGPFNLSCIALGAVSGWVGASSGLHLLLSATLTGLSAPGNSLACLISHAVDGQPCPVLYLPSADDDTWFTSLGGEPNSTWQPLIDGLGDSNEVFVDPALSSVTLAVRNGTYNLQVSNETVHDIATPDTSIETQTPSPGGIAEVMTMPNEAPEVEGDFIAVESLSTNPTRNPANGCTQDTSRNKDVIVRNLTAVSAGCHGWNDLAPNADFGPGFVGAIATSGGHSALTVYVMLSNNPSTNFQTFPPGPAGEIWKGQVDSTGHVPFWQNVSGTPPFAISRAYNLFANPYDPMEVWATDLGDRTIKVTRDGGKTWLPVPLLKDVATNHGEFAFTCGSFQGFGPDGYVDKQIFAADCPLTEMVFVRDHPEIRVATLYPGGVAFSRDAGNHWIPLDVINQQSSQPTELPQSSFYDSALNFRNGDTNLYIALEGKGLRRVEGPFPTLEGGLVVFCPGCPGGGGLLAGAAVNVIVGALATSVPLRLDGDGLYRGTVLFDSAKITSFDYQFEVNGKPTRRFRLNLNAGEIASGVTMLTNAQPPRFRGEIESHSQQAPGVFNVVFELTEVGGGAAQNLQITGVSFSTERGKGNVSLDRATAALLPILVGNLAESGSQTVPLVLDVPASVEKFRMTIRGTAQDGIGRSFPFEITKSLVPLGDRDEGDSSKN